MSEIREKKKKNATLTSNNIIVNFQPCRCLSEVISDKDILERDYICIQGFKACRQDMTVDYAMG